MLYDFRTYNVPLICEYNKNMWNISLEKKTMNNEKKMGVAMGAGCINITCD